MKMHAWNKSISEAQYFTVWVKISPINHQYQSLCYRPVRQRPAQTQLATRLTTTTTTTTTTTLCHLINYDRQWVIDWRSVTWHHVTVMDTKLINQLQINRNDRRQHINNRVNRHREGEKETETERAGLLLCNSCSGIQWCNTRSLTTM